MKRITNFKQDFRILLLTSYILIAANITYSQNRFNFETDFKYAASQNENNEYNHLFYLSGNINYYTNKITVGIILPFISQGNDTYTQLGTIFLKDSGLKHSNKDGHIQTSLTDGVTINNLKFGLGDIVFHSTFELTNELYSATSIYAKTFIKLPTASNHTNIGTGKVDVGFSFAVQKMILGLETYGSVGYWVLGNQVDHKFINPISIELSLGKSFSNGTYSVYIQFEGYTKIIENYTPPRHLSLMLKYFISKNTIITIRTSTGLSNSSPDFMLESKFDFIL